MPDEISDGASAPADVTAVASPALDEQPVSTPAPIKTDPMPADKPAPSDPKAGDAAKSEPVKPKAPISVRDSIKNATVKVVDIDKAKEAEVKTDAKPREPNGKFAEAQKPVEAQKPAIAPKDIAKAAELSPVPGKPTSYQGDVPARFHAEAKAAWATTPEPVRAEVNRTLRELEGGYEKHRADATAYADVRDFDRMAKEGGTTLRAALENYVGIEKLFQQNPIAGFERIAQNVGVSSQDLASAILGQAPDQRSGQQDTVIRTLQAKIDGMERELQGVSRTFQDQQNQTILDEIGRFAADKPRFEELSEDIAFFIKQGRASNLAEAYTLADRVSPAQIASPVTGPVEGPAAQTRDALNNPAGSAPDLPQVQNLNGAKSVSGAPSSGSTPASRPRSQPLPSIKDSLRRAVSQVSE